MDLNNKLIQLWRDDISIFAEDLLSSHLSCKTPEFHKELYQLIQNNDRLVLAAPRGFAKSHVISFFYVLHSALFMKRKDICIISASEALAIEWLRKIRVEIETNPLIQPIFGRLESSKWTENHLILNNEFKVNIRAKGAGAQIRGFRPDLIILDDIETDESVASTEQRDKLRDWILKACINTLPPTGKFIMIGTILHQQCLLKEFLEDDKPWQKKKYTAYRDDIQDVGHELWAELWSHERLQSRKKEIGSFAFHSEFLNNPIDNATAPIKTEYIRYWESLPKDLSISIAVDPAYSEDEKADYKVASVVGIDSRANRYLIEYIRTHKPSGEFIDGILNLYLKYKRQCVSVGVPCQGVEKEFYNKVLEKANSRGIYAPFIELKNAFTTGAGKVLQKKERRIIASLQPLFEAGKYYIHRDHIEAQDELLSIGKSRWDDVVDTLAYAEQILSYTCSLIDDDDFSQDNNALILQYDN